MSLADVFGILVTIAAGAFVYMWGRHNGQARTADVRRELDAMRERFDKQKALRTPTGTHYVDTTIEEADRQ